MIALSTDSLKGYGFKSHFDFAKLAKYDGVDLAIDPKNFDTQNTDYIRLLTGSIRTAACCNTDTAKLQPAQDGGSGKNGESVELPRYRYSAAKNF